MQYNHLSTKFQRRNESYKDKLTLFDALISKSRGICTKCFFLNRKNFAIDNKFCVLLLFDEIVLPFKWILNYECNDFFIIFVSWYDGKNIIFMGNTINQFLCVKDVIRNAGKLNFGKSFLEVE